MDAKEAAERAARRIVHDYLNPDSDERVVARAYSDERERADKLQAFKDWVHAYLDRHGVPHHPPGPHGAEGCRIGDRMDWLMARCDLARPAGGDVPCPPGCSRCAGEYCDTHGVQPCDCDTADRHAQPPADDAERPSVSERVESLREVLQDIEIDTSDDGDDAEPWCDVCMEHHAAPACTEPPADDAGAAVTFDELEEVFGDGSIIADRGDGTFAVDACFVVRTRADLLRLVEADKVE